MAEFSGNLGLAVFTPFIRPSGSGVATLIYLNASFDNGLPAGANEVTWFTIGASDPTRASAPVPVGAYVDFWVEDIITM